MFGDCHRDPDVEAGSCIELSWKFNGHCRAGQTFLKEGDFLYLEMVHHARLSLARDMATMSRALASARLRQAG